MLEILYVALPSGPLPVCSNEGSRVRNGPAPLIPWFQPLECIKKKNLPLQNHFDHMLDIWYVTFPSVCVCVCFQVYSNEGLMVQNGPAPGSPVFKL